MPEFYLPDGNPITVHPHPGLRYQAADDGTLITFVDGRSELAVEPYNEVKAALR
ncbi:hypothetical protein [Sphingomonas solaris]|uniref:hypothetical protein n=1 Tax=Alterirhizorhabdus solaris TaxID=2529389 RepID=UPI0013968C7A|nr:hypothetical protein [Sphingomonas solaris]